MQNVNSTGTFLFDGAVSKQMLLQEDREVQGRSGTRGVGKGAIVNMASLAGYAAGPRISPYNASKHAVMGLTKSAGKDLLPFRINIADRRVPFRTVLTNHVDL